MYDFVTCTCKIREAHINIVGIYPPLDENSKHQGAEDGPQDAPEPPAPGALGLALGRLEQRGLLMLVTALVVRGGKQWRLLRGGGPGRRPFRRFRRG